MSCCWPRPKVSRSSCVPSLHPTLHTLNSPAALCSALGLDELLLQPIGHNMK